MNDILKALLEGAVSSQSSSQRQAAVDPMADILGGILGGSAAPQPSRQGVDPMAEILGGILGGGSRRQMPAPTQVPSDPISGILGGILGGGHKPQNSGGMADIIGSIMGGGRRQASNPIANLLAEKLGISPMIANMIVSYFMSKFLSGKVGHMIPDNHEGISSRKIDTRGGSSLDLDDLLDVMDDDNAINSRLQNSGMSEELAKYAGIDKKTAHNSLAELVKILGGQRQMPTPVKSQSKGLAGLLDSWETD